MLSHIATSTPHIKHVTAGYQPADGCRTTSLASDVSGILKLKTESTVACPSSRGTGLANHRQLPESVRQVRHFADCRGCDHELV